MSSHGGEKGGFSMSDSEEGDSTLADLLKSTPHGYDKEGQPNKGCTASPSTKLARRGRAGQAQPSKGAALCCFLMAKCC